ncbi:transport protein Avl9-domain-containing protein [Kockovaella imperatae]|uniref:Transport protein Avl9-domain-containing protein n=1 Tax=Kockovaella imperatae TaxID=4999 RepID=A0A1Y1UR07_9TREE|nr:transport protein Avl9-domain-containing protein [Kockovaella imperatae]ORX40483.1 transport protein Avl9-domain-containing protein [Kockovaella imperatae]
MSQSSRPASGYDVYEDLSLDDDPKAEIKTSSQLPPTVASSSSSSLMRSPSSYTGSSRSAMEGLGSPNSISSSSGGAKSSPWERFESRVRKDSSGTATPQDVSSPAVDQSGSRFSTPSHVMSTPPPHMVQRDERPGPSSRPSLLSHPTGSSMSVMTALAKDLENVPLVLGVVLVDFNHLIGPTVEFAYPPSLQSALTADDELNRILPFLALPDGAHLTEEDYSYFHCSYRPPNGTVAEQTDVPVGTTLFGISCNRQLQASELLVRPSDVTRTTVQKAIVVIASQPVFGPIRDRLGVVTRAFFAQRDFTQTQILQDFYTSLESSLDGKSGESAIYMGTSLRELIHKFRHRTLVLLKILMLQKRIMLYGHPVEMLCTYQYSLVSLMPGLLMNLRDCGSAELDAKTTRTRPNSLRTSDRASVLRFMGLPLHLFGNGCFFQPYLPLQQMDDLAADSWLIGTTNQIVTQSRENRYDLLVNIENMSFEFSDPKMERIVNLTPADRKWMDDVVKAVEETWDLPEGERASFRGSDDDLRSRFEEYISGALSSLKFAEFKLKGKAQDLSIVGVAGEENPLQPFSELWLEAFRQTQAYEVWSGCTDPVLFDICEPRHPCDGRATLISDFSLRLTEGIHDLKLDQQLGPTREVLSSAFSAGSTALAAGSSTFWKTFDGVKADISSRIEAEKQRRATTTAAAAQDGQGGPLSSGPSTPVTGIRDSAQSTPNAPINDIKATLGGIGSSVGSFFGNRVASFRSSAAKDDEDRRKGLRPMSLSPSASADAKRRSG